MILVTGATGQLGTAVIQQLLKKTSATQIAAFVRDAGKAADLKEKGIDIRVGNYDDTASLDTAVQGVNKVLLISSTDEGNRTQQHHNVIDAAKRVGVQSLAYTSRNLKNADTLANGLMKEHFQTEAYLKDSGLTYALFRNALYLDTVPQFVGGERVFAAGISVPAGDGKVAYALRSEQGEAIANALLESDSENKVYKLTGSDAWSFYDVADALTELSGKEVSYTPVDEATFAA